MKFIHLSDIGIGNSTESGTGWEAARRTELLENLRRVLQRATENGTRLVLVSGGLFSHTPSEAELEVASEIFGTYPKIHVVIVSGDYDPITGNSAIHSFTWPENVHYVRSGILERIVLPELETEIFAASILTQNDASEEETSDEQVDAAAEQETVSEEESEAEPKEDTPMFSLPEAMAIGICAAEDRKPIRIAMLCSEEKDELTEGLAKAFSEGGLSYAAVGSRTLDREIEKNRIYSCGRLEPIDAGDTGEHGILEGEISEESGELEEIRFIPMASAAYVTLAIKVRPETKAGELLRSIEKEMERRGANNIYRLRLSGRRNPEMMPDLSGLQERFRIRELIDETQPEYDFAGLFREHPQDMIGFYISSIANRKTEMSPIEKKAMYYGIDALLKTAEDEESL